MQLKGCLVIQNHIKETCSFYLIGLLYVTYKTLQTGFRVLSDCLSSRKGFTWSIEGGMNGAS